MRRYFIIGTDTHCGKTHVTSQMQRAFQSRRHTTLAIKPVASGGIERQGQWINEDVWLLQQGNPIQNIEICRWSLKSAISPHLAAQQDGVSLSAQAIAEHCLSPMFDGFERLLIEGAGGLLVPLNAHETWLDVLIQTKIPVILVVGMRLGCLNHALLTDSVLRMHQIRCVGWVANCLDPNMLALPENITTLKQKLHSPLLATLPFDAATPNIAFYYHKTKGTGKGAFDGMDSGKLRGEHE